MVKNTITTTHTLIVIYAIMLVIELLCCVPYERIEIFRSEQNVPHTEIIGSGYSSIIEISSNDAYMYSNQSTSSGKRVNTPQLATNLIVTTFVMAVLYFMLVVRKKKPDQASSDKASALQQENQQLRGMVGDLMRETIAMINIKTTYADIPKLDVNALAFADTETVQAAQEQYAQDMLRYIKGEMHKNFTAAHQDIHEETHK